MKKLSQHLQKTFQKIFLMAVLAFFTLGISLSLAADPATPPAGGTPATPTGSSTDKPEDFRSFSVGKYLTVNNDDGNKGDPKEKCSSGNSSIGVQCQTYLKSTNPTASFILQLINFVVTLVGSLAFFAIVYGGFTYITAAGNENNITKAKEIIVRAVTGLIITLSAYFIVSFVQGLLFETVK